ncbi:hypothetical protein SAMN05444397_10512 [Flavobacterium aquidurense]|uniref:DUF2092 domain-containing protein n=1 Tax=Flavobacterium frigidimaris TaxID=262320 RepID=A0ABX4BTF8_FLAFR|nr:DUF2092 domain-containing protein [Flavobacterium frigidimaris]OXA80161.1 hypothetical protein B0A65_07500 [Flavobacterium frigidimaris]SDZ28669.1 hypothetical protein SAMN05444397_10512 [Flavobacterium aquidurense]
MNKKFLFLMGLVILTITAKGQTQRIDSTAVFLLHRTSETLQDITSCSFTTVTTYDVFNDNLGLIKHALNEKVTMKFPDKMKVVSSGDKGNKGLWYNGKTLNYYSFDNNTYANTTAPGSIIETIDESSKKFGIEFPGADFFYPDFLKDLFAEQGNLVFLGKTIVDGRECFHIAGSDKTKSFQFWIGNDDLFLPVKLVIIYTSDKDKPQYEAIYKDWIVNTDYPNSMFEFMTPPKSTKVKFAPRETSK